MNSDDRRRQKAKNKFVRDYVHHLPEVGPEVLTKPGVTHIVYYHDDWCNHHKGGECNCEPHVKFFSEPKRS
jgi:hypothetical protein